VDLNTILILSLLNLSKTEEIEDEEEGKNFIGQHFPCKKGAVILALSFFFI
jgi:hypothetical protein